MGVPVLPGTKQSASRGGGYVQCIVQRRGIISRGSRGSAKSRAQSARIAVEDRRRGDDKKCGRCGAISFSFKDKAENCELKVERSDLVQANPSENWICRPVKGALEQTVSSSCGSLEQWCGGGN
jgi:hypothetical protein